MHPASIRTIQTIIVVVEFRLSMVVLDMEGKEKCKNLPCFDFKAFFSVCKFFRLKTFVLINYFELNIKLRLF